MNLRFFRKKTVPLPTIWTWLSLLLLFALVIYCFSKNIYFYLTITEPVHGQLLVVEGWIHDYAIEEAVEIFDKGSYQFIISIGLPIEQGTYLSKYKTSAAIAAETMRRIGVREDVLVTIDVPHIKKDRTYSMALCLKEWIKKNGRNVDSIDIVSLGTHSRRSRRMYNAVFRDEIKIGIYGIQDRSFDNKRWWRTSHGFKVIINSVLSYFYAVFLFNK